MSSRRIRRAVVPVLAVISAVGFGQHASATSGSGYTTAEVADMACAALGWGPAVSTGQDADSDGEIDYECSNAPKVDPVPLPPADWTDDERLGPRPDPFPLEPFAPVPGTEGERPLPLGDDTKLYGRP